MNRLLLILLACSLLVACYRGGDAPPEQSHATAKKAGKKKSVRRIKLYRYDDFSVAKAQSLAASLRAYYPAVEVKSAPIALPVEHYNKPRNRYSATGLLKDLLRYRKDDVALGLTDEVVFIANEMSPTYGIFGASPVGMYVAVISSTRPSGKPHSSDHLTKLMLHELGHAFGLQHCGNQHCFMVDAEHGNKFSQTPSFCGQCRKFLNANGWTVKP